MLFFTTNPITVRSIALLVAESVTLPVICAAAKK